MDLRQKILCILSDYQFIQANSEALIRIKTAFETIGEEMTSIAKDKGFSNVRVSSAFSQGKQSTITPWIALFDVKENTALYREVYLMLLFKADMSGVYLTVNQGAGMMYSAPIYVLNYLDDVDAGSIELKKEFLQLLDSGFSFDGNIDLADSGIIAEAHERATVVYKFYDRNQLLLEDEIESDIDKVLDAYEHFMGNLPFGDAKLGKTRAAQDTYISTAISPIIIPDSFKEEFYGLRKPTTVVSAYQAERNHGLIVNTFSMLLRQNGIKTVNSIAIDLLSIDSVGKPISLFEAKTDASTTSIYGAIGQLLYHSTNLNGKCKLVAIFPNTIDAYSKRTFQRLNIECITYEWVKNLPHFNNLDLKKL